MRTAYAVIFAALMVSVFVTTPAEAQLNPGRVLREVLRDRRLPIPRPQRSQRNPLETPELRALDSSIEQMLAERRQLAMSPVEDAIFRLGNEKQLEPYLEARATVDTLERKRCEDGVSANLARGSTRDPVEGRRRREEVQSAYRSCQEASNLLEESLARFAIVLT